MKYRLYTDLGKGFTNKSRYIYDNVIALVNKMDKVISDDKVRDTIVVEENNDCDFPIFCGKKGYDQFKKRLLYENKPKVLIKK